MIVASERPTIAAEPGSPPAFLITIDTEGDNIWSNPREVTTRNSLFLPRFQALCERYGFKPTWLTNYEMARCRDYQDFARDVQRRGTGEIGMHLHAWDSPPIVPLPSPDEPQPLLIDFAVSTMRDKVAVMTDVLEDTFGTKMTSHRAGRWGFNAAYARLLVERGYIVDCSVTPHVAWPAGSDYTGFPDDAYFLDLDDIARAAQPGAATLLELPVTIAPAGTVARQLNTAVRHLPSLARRAVARLAPAVHWLRPSGGNLSAMLELLRTRRAQNRSYVEFMLHSSEFMPGGSPRFDTEAKIERLYEDMEQLFEQAAKAFRGATLTEFATEVRSRPAPALSPL